MLMDKKTLIDCCQVVNFSTKSPDGVSANIESSVSDEEIRKGILEGKYAELNLYQHAKHQVISLIVSGEIVDLKILQSDWLSAFSQIQDFPKYKMCAGTQQMISNFIMKQIQ